MTNCHDVPKTFDEQMLDALGPWGRMAARILPGFRVNVTLLPGFLTVSYGMGGQGVASARCGFHAADPTTKW